MVTRLLFILLVASVAFGQTTTPNLGLIVPANGQTSWDTLPTGGINANWATLDAKVMSNTPVADQTITGAHGLILSNSGSSLTERGTTFLGPPFSSFSAFSQAQLFTSGIPTNVTDTTNTDTAAFQSAFQANTIGGGGIFGVGIVDLAADTAVFTQTEGVVGWAYANLNNHTISHADAGIGGVAGIASVTGPGHMSNMFSQAAYTNSLNAGAVVDLNAGFQANSQAGVGTTNAAFHADDQGAGASNYGILLDGVTHNDLGGGVTKVGNLLDSGLTASLPVVANGSKQLVSASANIPSVFLCGTTTACANTLQNTPIIVFGTVALSSGTPSTATLTALPFAGTTAYVCTGTNQTTATNNLIKFANASASSTVITGPNTITDVIGYTCVGH